MMFKLGILLKSAVVGALLTVAPLAASAATISGTIGITGTVNMGTSVFAIGGNVDLNDPGNVIIATGDFSVLPTGLAGYGTVALTDISFAAPGVIWSAGAFTFTATSFVNFVDEAVNKGFTALGVMTAAGFDATTGIMSFTSQELTSGATATFSSTTVVPLPAAGFLLFGALGGLGFVGRRRRKAA
jgi:hypothetical protein